MIKSGKNHQKNLELNTYDGKNCDEYNEINEYGMKFCKNTKRVWWKKYEYHGKKMVKTKRVYSFI